MDKTPTLYLKDPYLRAIKQKKTKFLITIVQLPLGIIWLKSGTRRVKISITQSERVPVNEVSFHVLDSIGYKSRMGFRNSLESLHHRKLEEVYINEVVVQ